MIEYGATEDAQMEEYLENVKRLRSQMNDIEEAAANRSVEEQKQKTAIVALETDISSVKAETKRLNDEAEEMLKAKANIGSEITEKQRKLSLLEAESCSLSQTVELLKQAVANLLLRLKEKRLHYGNISEELNLKVQKQQEWYNSYMLMIEDPTSGMGSAEEEIFLDKENKNAAHWMQMSSENMGDENTERCGDLDLKSAKMKLDELEIKKLQIIEDRVKTQQLLEQMNSKMQSTPSALMEMAVKALENEYSSVKADKAGELEYLQSLEARIDQLKNLSYIINCQCGNEYKVELAN
ncbi:uncharacterized protein LOC121997216 isoform X1 [Zingiber officinale]|uniref:uncharacterized protein LOC121997216 isoform X1 n=1 Tax=Zingiber officinale TaxID=94328 RepID=UPI001C4CBC22|nr:uncharacterized protein LOC121997216 isoform X1 [Zingiber officinale]XP_042407445.1 uncharacterized protein LOC121997216 isoform X1 [Zingiber officinale]